MVIRRKFKRLYVLARSVARDKNRNQRVMSVAAVQQQLLASRHGEPIDIGPYLSRLCETLAASMTDDSRPISLKVQAEGGTASSAEAVSIGLIVTELVINDCKQAFICASHNTVVAPQDVKNLAYNK